MTVMTKRPATAEQTSDKLRGLLRMRNLHFAGVAVLALVNLYLLAHIFFAWTAASSRNADALEQQTVAMKTAEIAKKPLEGLDTKLATATWNADTFYQQRLPFATSEVAGELGALAKKDGVRLTRVGYTYVPVMAGSSGALTEVRMDAGLTGDYRPLVRFINALERDRMFFLIDGVSLTGEQSGTVGLRLRMTTYLRAPVGAETTEKSFGSTSDAVAAGAR